MNEFLPFAGLALVLALAVVLRPLLRSSDADADGERSAGRVSAVATVLLVPLLAIGLYARWSNYDWAQGNNPPAGDPQVAAIEEMVQGLEQRLAGGDGTLEEWQMLGRSRFVLGEYAAAADAYRSAYRLSGGNDAETLSAYAEALALAEPGALTADAGDLFERALAIDPNNVRALWYGGLAAFEQGRLGVAKERWLLLMEQSPPPEDVRRVIEQRLAFVDEQLGETPAAASTTDATPAAVAGNGAAGDGAEAITVDISLAPALAATVNQDAPLFIIARAPGGGGPPFAVVRRTARELPVSITLSDRDAMMAGRTLSTLQAVELVARVALAGSPTATAGDLYGVYDYERGRDDVATIVIDKVQP